MKSKKLFKRIAIVAAFGIGLSAFSPVLAQAETSTTATSQKLVDSLKALNIDQVDYLYAYLQSVDLTDSEYNKIVANADQVASLINGVSDPTKLDSAKKAEVTRLFLESAQLAHLQVAFVDDKGKEISLTDYNFSNGLLLQVKDLNGKLLGTINPTKADLNPQVLSQKIEALKTAVSAKVELDKSGKFVPMPSAALPNTATNLPLNIALGGLLVLLGALTVKPALTIAKKLDKPSEI